MALAGAFGAGLTSLRLAWTHVTAETWASIAASLSPALTELDLSFNPVGLRALAASLAPLTRLVRLEARRHGVFGDFGDADAEGLFDVLRTMPLVHLDLSGNKTNLGIAPHLPSTLTHVNLSRF